MIFQVYVSCSDGIKAVAYNIHSEAIQKITEGSVTTQAGFSAVQSYEIPHLICIF